MKNPQNILITGASSGIGYSLAIAYAAPNVNLFLCARNKEKLSAVKTLCEAKGANILTESFDIKDEKLASDFVQKIEKQYPIDLLIASAGVAFGKDGADEIFDDAKQIIATNINGVINIVYPVMAKMRQRQKGQIAIISSLAGFCGIPSSPAYSASKSAVRIYAQILGVNLKKYNINVSVVCPGYVDTPMIAENKFHMPFLMDATKAAKIIKKSLAKNKSTIAFPFPMYFGALIMGIIPRKIINFAYYKLCTTQ